MTKNLKYSLLLFCSLFFTAALAKEPYPLDYQLNCKPVGFHFKHKELFLKGPSHSKQVAVYLFNNISSSSFTLNHTTNNKGSANAGWGSIIGPHNWSALVVDRNNLNWTCERITPKKAHSISCNSVLQVCKYDGIVNLRAESGYWHSENKSLTDTLNALK